jgi:hypothetical protein
MMNNTALNTPVPNANAATSTPQGTSHAYLPSGYGTPQGMGQGMPFALPSAPGPVPLPQ